MAARKKPTRKKTARKTTMRSRVWTLPKGGGLVFISPELGRISDVPLQHALLKHMEHVIKTRGVGDHTTTTVDGLSIDIITSGIDTAIMPTSAYRTMGMNVRRLRR